jgi:hypothetical protein
MHTFFIAADEIQICMDQKSVVETLGKQNYCTPDLL